MCCYAVGSPSIPREATVPTCQAPAPLFGKFHFTGDTETWIPLTSPQSTPACKSIRLAQCEPPSTPGDTFKNTLDLNSQAPVENNYTQKPLVCRHCTYTLTHALACFFLVTLHGNRKTFPHPEVHMFGCISQILALGI